MSTEKIYTVKEVAEKFGITDARVRQLCIDHDIGSIKGNTRILSAEDLKRFEKVRSDLRQWEKRNGS